MIPPSYLFKSVYFDEWERPAPVAAAKPAHLGGGDGWHRRATTWLASAGRLALGFRPPPVTRGDPCAEGPAFGH